MAEKIASVSGCSLSDAQVIINQWLNGRVMDKHLELEFEKTVLKKLNSLRIALLVVDFQNDFVSGSLKIGDGDAKQDPETAIAPLNKLLKSSKWDLLVYTKDWHLPNHISFLSQAQNSDRRLSDDDKNRELNFFDTVDFEAPVKTTQMLYPEHCVQDTWGSEILKEIEIIPNSHIILKGVDSNLDSYSAFFDNNGQSKTELEDLLRKENIDGVVVAGLAYDICVRYSCIDAAKLNFLVSVIPECSAGFLKQGVEDTNKIFEEKGISILSAQEALKISTKSFIPIEWIKKLVFES